MNAEGSDGGVARGRPRRGPTPGQRFIAWFLARGMAGYERRLAPHKQALFAGLRPGQTVLEIGPGAGANFPYYPAGLRWVGVEPNPAMHAYLRERLQAGGLRAGLVQGQAEALPVASANCDLVVSTLVLCSVRDPARVLGEVRRVLRPGGLLLLLEHVAAPAGQPLWRWQRRLGPLWTKLADGCHPDRDTARILSEAGFACDALQRFNGLFWLVRPHLFGAADPVPANSCGPSSVPR